MPQPRIDALVAAEKASADLATALRERRLLSREAFEEERNRRAAVTRLAEIQARAIELESIIEKSSRTVRDAYEVEPDPARLAGGRS